MAILMIFFKFHVKSAKNALKTAYFCTFISLDT